MLSIADVMAPGEWISHTSYLHDIAFARDWAIYKGGPAAGQASKSSVHQLWFLSEVDTSLIGLGGPVTRFRAELTCESNLYPRCYRVTTRDSTNEVVFNEEIAIHLADGTEHKMQLSKIDCVLGETVGQLALLLKLAGSEIAREFRCSFFSFGAASVLDYQMSVLEKQTADKARWFASSFGEEILIGDDGWLREHFVPKEGISTRAEQTPLPAWIEETILEAPLVYQPQQNSSIVLKDVSVPGPVVPIGATLTMPREGSRHPLALFIGGSGSHDRHGIASQVDLGSHEIIDFLSENGWLCARFDTRGAGNTALGVDFFQMGFEEIVADARAVLKYLMEVPDGDSGCVVLIGHSQGGVTAIELAIREPRINGIVLLATSARRIDEVLRDQIVVRGEWLNQTREQIDKQLHDLDEFIRLVQGNQEWTAEAIPARFYAASRFRQWYRDHLCRVPLDLIARIQCPVLICQGDKDFQVSLKKDAEPLYEAAVKAGLQAELRVFEGLDHLFKPVDGDSHISQYYDRSRRVSEDLKLTVLRFLEKIGSQHLGKL
jgi:pimeloyl-ACP methyl ester carboxylesterase